MYSRYVPNKLLISHKSQLLFIYNDDSIRDLTSLGSLRTFSESVVFRRNVRGVMIGRTINLNCCTQQENCNSGLPAPYTIKTLRMILIFQLESSRLMCICWH